MPNQNPFMAAFWAMANNLRRIAFDGQDNGSALPMCRFAEVAIQFSFEF